MGYVNTIRKVSGGGPDEWVRPANWLPRPTIAIGEKVIYYLVRVTENGDNYVGFTIKGNYTVNWGYGATEDFNSGVSATKNIDYTQLIEWWDETETDKQCWVKITPQVGQLFNFHLTHPQDFKDALKNTFNACVVEVLVGKMNVIIDTYAFHFAYMAKLKCLKFYETVEASNNQRMLAYESRNLECVEGELRIASFNQNMFVNNYCLRYLNNFNLIGAGAIDGLFKYTGVKNIYLPDFEVINSNSTIYANYQLESATFKKSNSGYLHARYCYNLNSYTLLEDLGNTPNFPYAFQYCNFEETPTLNLTSSTDNYGMFDYNYNLKKSNLSNIKARIGFNTCNLNHAAIYKIIDEQLQNVVATQILDVRNNPNVANLPASTIAIATGKNWTVQIV